MPEIDKPVVLLHRAAATRAQVRRELSVTDAVIRIRSEHGGSTRAALRRLVDSHKDNPVAVSIGNSAVVGYLFLLED